MWYHFEIVLITHIFVISWSKKIIPGYTLMSHSHYSKNKTKYGNLPVISKNLRLQQPVAGCLLSDRCVQVCR